MVGHFVSCTVVMSVLLVFMMCASSLSLLGIPFMLICKILRSCLLCCADCWWLVAGVIWGVLGSGYYLRCCRCRCTGCESYLGCGGCGCTGC